MNFMPKVKSKDEREITVPVEMCLPNGRLNPEAVGWSRFPMHRDNLKGWGRNKRFEYWCVMSEEFIVTANISHHDYRANVASTFVDLETDQVISRRINRWLPEPGALPNPTEPRRVSQSAEGIVVAIEPVVGGTRLRVDSDRIRLDATVIEPEGHQSMGVLVPWNDRTFQYTRKDNCLATRGSVIVDGVERTIDPAKCLAVHDVGRGRWPYSTWWNWSAASGETDGRQIGLQFGGKWTVGTPSTENALRIDGCIHKISEELDWAYDTNDFLSNWTIRGNRVDLTFTPMNHHRHRFNRWIVSARGDQCFGHFNGHIVADDGEVLRVGNILGMVEEVHRRW
ncbi:DUF2804 domain-containing protein [Hoeflea sp. WL0058]|uniref:DUF2804 domain-containing protein n=1 Tax=Flavimaribacter sediminis TaxID=2865987 RepID=A0AAE2ZR15_9HYPH|nr:DUF2804 domain-containing protein [Flavimaribacter sediminis]MBW8639207.1 DUF2804 domain-containing protein [Flavimaribacter sediminis]